MDDDDTEDLTTCQICCEEYSLNERIPRFLPCTHTVCETCILQIINLDPKGVVTCPECRKDHMISKREGVHSFHQNKYILAHLRKQKQQTVQVDVCQQHNRPFSLYCEEERCQAVICTKCLVEQHNGHTTSDLIEKVETCRKQINEEISQMVDSLGSSRQKGGQAMLRLFQTTHQALNILEERKALLGRMIDEQVSDIENKALYHYKTQATVINKQDQQLVEAIKEVSSLAAEFTNMRNSDVLRHLESKRQLCQQIVHNAVKTVGIAGVNDLHVLTYDPTDDRGICESQQRDDKHVIAQLVGNLTRSRPSEQKISHYQAIKDDCKCHLCMDRKTLLEGDEEDTDLQNGGIVTVDVDAAWPHIDESDFCIEQDTEECGAVGGEGISSVILELKGTSDEMVNCGLRPVSVYSADDYTPRRQISYLKRIDQFADLCPEPPSSQGRRMKSQILRLMPLSTGQLQSFGDYGLYYVQAKTFSDDQYMKEQLFESSSRRDLETVNCEEEVLIGDQRYVAIAALHSLRTHYVINFYPKETGRRYCIDLLGRSVRFMCQLDSSKIIYAYTESESAGLANMVFCKVGFLQYHPIPELKGGDFTTDYTSLCTMCALTNGPQPLILLCGSRTDLENPGMPCLTAYTNEGQALWRRSLINPHSVCTDGFGNLFVAVDEVVLLFDANGTCTCKLFSSDRDNLGKEGNMCLAFRSSKSQLVVSHVCKYEAARNVKGVNGKYDPVTVFNFYRVGYRDD